MTTSPLSHNSAMSGAPRRSRYSIGSTIRGACRWSLVLILTVTAIWKLLDLAYFEQVVKSGGFLPASYVPWVARGVPISELLIALALCIAPIELVGTLLAVFLSAGFAGFHAYLYFNGIVIPCGCAGIRETLPRSSDHLWMIFGCIGMLAASTFLLFCAPPIHDRRAAATTRSHNQDRVSPAAVQESPPATASRS